MKVQRFKLSDVWLPLGTFWLILVLSLVRFRKRTLKKSKIKRTSKKTSPIRFYKEYESILKKQGYQREAAETPKCFAFRVQHSTNATHHQIILEKYYATRFGRTNLTHAEQKKVKESLKSLQARGKKVGVGGQVLVKD